MNSEVEFTYEIAENFLDEVLKEKKQKYLSDVEKLVFKGSWNGSSYRVIAEGSNYTEEYLKDIGKILWDKLSKLLEEKVSKKNLTEVFRLKLKQQSSQRQHNRQLLENAIYIERQPIESICDTTILQPGSLIRIKAPRQMGKTWLTNRILEQAKKHDYQTACINLLDTDTAYFQDLNQFLRWFCSSIGRELNVPKKNLNESWDKDDGGKTNCKIYFEECLLPIITEALVLCIDKIDLISPYPIAEDFLGLLRSWHETAKRKYIWKKLRLVVIHSTEVYIVSNINKSPFNVGEAIELPEFKFKQIYRLTEIYKLSWQPEEVNQLTNLVGGHPFLVHRALSYLRNNQDLTLSKLLEKAATNSGIYRSHLQELLSILEANIELKAAFKKVVMEKESVNIDSLLTYKLYSLGLVKLVGNDVLPRCELYRQYFYERLK